MLNDLDASRDYVDLLREYIAHKGLSDEFYLYEVLRLDDTNAGKTYFESVYPKTEGEQSITNNAKYCDNFVTILNILASIRMY